jgi:hypothetical protein
MCHGSQSRCKSYLTPVLIIQFVSDRSIPKCILISLFVQFSVSAYFWSNRTVWLYINQDRCSNSPLLKYMIQIFFFRKVKVFLTNSFCWVTKTGKKKISHEFDALCIVHCKIQLGGMLELTYITYKIQSRFFLFMHVRLSCLCLHFIYRAIVMI